MSETPPKLSLLPAERRRQWLINLRNPEDAPSPEDVVLYAEGRLDLVPESRRDALLNAIATDPVWSDVIDDLQAYQEAQAQEPETAPTAAPEPKPAPAPLYRFVAWSRWTLRASAAAACVAIGLGVWSFLDPAAAPPPGGGTMRSTGVEPVEFPWREVLSILWFVLSLMLFVVWGLQAIFARRQPEP